VPELKCMIVIFVLCWDALFVVGEPAKTVVTGRRSDDGESDSLLWKTLKNS
jgi:hypothetical protein